SPRRRLHRCWGGSSGSCVFRVYNARLPVPRPAATFFAAARDGSFEELPMVVIRLARGGAKKRPFYNIVVADSRERRDGRFIERVGFYNPMAAGGEQALRVAFDRIEHWASTGAQLSPTVAGLVAQSRAAA